MGVYRVTAHMKRFCALSDEIVVYDTLVSVNNIMTTTEIYLERKTLRRSFDARVVLACHKRVVVHGSNLVLARGEDLD